MDLFTRMKNETSVSFNFGSTQDLGQLRIDDYLAKNLENGYENGKGSFKNWGGNNKLVSKLVFLGGYS